MQANDLNTQYLTNDVKKLNKKIQEEKFVSLIHQVQAEYALCWLNQNVRIQENLLRLKLYNNQKRDKDLVGDPLMFTIFQTVFASLYNDTLNVVFKGREEGDEETGDNLTRLAKYDHDLMDKDILDYEWLWDAMFSGRGLVLMQEFDRSPDVLAPVPQTVDAMTFLHDPYANSVNGRLGGRGQMRFGGFETEMTKWQMQLEGGFIDLDFLQIGDDIKSMIRQAKQMREDAQGLNQSILNNLTADAFGDNINYQLLRWFTHWHGKKVEVVLGNRMKMLVKYKELGNASIKWPLLDKPLYPSSHTWEGVSIPDLTEDKQRHRSVALNLGMNAMKLDLYPSYLFDEKRIRNKADLQNIEFNKFHPVFGGGDPGTAIRPLNKASINQPLLDFILNSLDLSAQKATATPDMQQGATSTQDTTLGELNLMASRVDTRYSLAAKVFGWSDKAFWKQWYWLYKKHFQKGIDKKVIRVDGSYGNKWRPLLRSNIVTDTDPDVVIESSVMSDMQNYKERIMLTAFGSAYVLPDPTSNKRYFQKHMARLNGMTNDQIERLYPATVEELKAEDENDLLNKDKVPMIKATDDHIVHMEIHAKADETDAKMAHILAHRRAMEIQRQQPDLFPQQNPNQMPMGGAPSQPGQLPQGLGALSNVANSTPSQVPNNNTQQ